MLLDFLFSRSNAFDANIGIIAKFVYYEKTRTSRRSAVVLLNAVMAYFILLLRYLDLFELVYSFVLQTENIDTVLHIDFI